MVVLTLEEAEVVEHSLLEGMEEQPHLLQEEQEEQVQQTQYQDHQ